MKIKHCMMKLMIFIKNPNEENARFVIIKFLEKDNNELNSFNF